MCPPSRSCSSVGNRDSRTRRASCSFRASASAHLSTSPGGSTPNWSRSWPELPPLSNIVTTALTRSQGFCFNPPSKLGRPVPPPKQPTFKARNCMRALSRIRDRGSSSTCARQSVTTRQAALSRFGLFDSGAALFCAAGYRYGVSDQVFYVPAILLSADPSLNPRDSSLIQGCGPLDILGPSSATCAGTDGGSGRFSTHRA